LNVESRALLCVTEREFDQAEWRQFNCLLNTRYISFDNRIGGW
jgi:hypothetical protein